MLAEAHVSMPGKVESFDADSQTADIQPQIKRRLRHEDGTVTFERLPKIPNVPVLYFRAGGFFDYAPLQQGDRVVLHFTDYSLDEWWEQGRETEPKFAHSHELTDCFATPGGYTKADPLSSMGTSKQRIGTSDLHISNDGSVIKIGDGASEFIALAQKVLTELTNITNAFNGHTHSVVLGLCTAGGATGTAVSTGGPSYTPQSVAATKAKAE